MIAIIGAGISGVAVALFLKKAGKACIIYDCTKEAEGKGYVFNLSKNGLHVLYSLNLTEKVIEMGTSINTMRFKSQNGEELTSVPATSVSIKRNTLLTILINEAERQGIKIEYSKKVIKIDNLESQAIVYFEDKPQIKVDLVIGADGVRSIVRQSFLEDVKPEYIGMMGTGSILTKFDQFENIPPKDVIQITSGYEGAFGMTQGDSGQLQYWCNIPQQKELSREELKEINIKSLLLEKYNGWHSPVESLIQQSSNIHPLIPVYQVPHLKSWFLNRCVLIGDAAHAMSPNAGQGASTALEDALSLALHLKKYDFKEAFPLYEKQRKQRTEQIKQQGKDNTDRLHKKNRVQYWMGNLFMKYVFNWLFTNYSIPFFDYKENFNE